MLKSILKIKPSTKTASAVPTPTTTPTAMGRPFSEENRKELTLEQAIEEAMAKARAENKVVTTTLGGIGYTLSALALGDWAKRGAIPKVVNNAAKDLSRSASTTTLEEISVHSSSDDYNPYAPRIVGGTLKREVKKSEENEVNFDSEETERMTKEEEEDFCNSIKNQNGVVKIIEYSRKGVNKSVLANITLAELEDRPIKDVESKMSSIRNYPNPLNEAEHVPRVIEPENIEAKDECKPIETPTVKTKKNGFLKKIFRFGKKAPKNEEVPVDKPKNSRRPYLSTYGDCHVPPQLPSRNVNNCHDRNEAIKTQLDRKKDNDEVQPMKLCFLCFIQR